MEYPQYLSPEFNPNLAGTPKPFRRKRVSLESLVPGTSAEDRPGLQGVEEDFLKAAELGDIPTIKSTLQRTPDFDVNCSDLLGRTPLRLAVENGHLEIVEMLLDRTDPRNIYNGLLLAISLDHDEIALTILRHPIYLMMEKTSGLIKGDHYTITNDESSPFAADTTPLILAAQRNRFAIVSLLLRRGQSISSPHVQECECHHCYAMTFIDELHFAKSRLNAYKGLASESYIGLSSDDPILTSFLLRQKLLKAAVSEKHYKEEYEALTRKLSNFVVKLLDNVRGNEELFLLLQQESSHDDDDDDDNLSFSVSAMPRLKLALKYNEKGFVSHPSCQKVLTSVWYGNYTPQQQRLPRILRPLSKIVLVGLVPVLALFYCLIPLPKVKTFLSTPFVKFVGQSTSFMVFLTLILVFSVTESPTNAQNEQVRAYLANMSCLKYLEKNASDKLDLQDFSIRPTLPGHTQITICIFLLGLIWQECKQLYHAGLADHFGSLFNVIDFVLLKLYIASFALRYLTYYKKTWRATQFVINNPDFVLLILHREPQAHYHLYWLIADRFYWAALDPINICEGLFAVANVLSFSRLFYLLATSEQLGPLQVSLRRMISDVSHFLVIFLIVVTAFMVGLNNLYWYYDPSVRKLVELHSRRNQVTNAESAFGTLEQTFTTVFWALFGMAEPSVVELSGDYAANVVTGRIGYWVFGAYNLVAVIVLINMLIAMMSRSFEFIQNDEDMEWKFARAALYMDFMTDKSFLPVPFNIIPSTHSVYSVIKVICVTVFHAGQGIYSAATWVLGGASDTENVSNEFVMNNFNNSDQVSADDNIKQETSKDAFSSEQQKPQTTEHHNNYLSTVIRTAIYNTGKGSLFSKPMTANNRKMSYESVIENVVKRYIFQSQNVQQSPLEAAFEELKKDLSSFRFEVLNLLSTQRKALQESINLVSAKLDLSSSDQYGGQVEYLSSSSEKTKGVQQKDKANGQVDNTNLKTPSITVHAPIDLWEGSWNDVKIDNRSCNDSLEVEEEPIIPQISAKYSDNSNIINNSKTYSERDIKVFVRLLEQTKLF